MQAHALVAALAVLVGATVSPSPTATPEARRDILWTEEKRYSHLDEELVIRDFFQDRRDGFFVDIGCAYPKKSSNTFYLEKHLGWTGVGVDGVPEYAAGWAKYRPGSTFENYLVTAEAGGEGTFYQGAVRGLSTAEKDVAAARTTVREIQVPRTTLDALLEKHEVARVDLVSIDVEGHHEEVLAGFDLQRWKPDLVVIEEEGFYAVPWFRARGYEPIVRYRERDIVNWYFAPKERAAELDTVHSEVGSSKLRERRERLENEPPSSALRTFFTPKVVLNEDREPVANPAARPAADP